MGSTGNITQPVRCSDVHMIRTVRSRCRSYMRARTSILRLDRVVATRCRTLPLNLRISVHSPDLAAWFDLYGARFDSYIAVSRIRISCHVWWLAGLLWLTQIIAVLARDLDTPSRHAPLAHIFPRTLKLVGGLCRCVWVTLIVARRVCRVSGHSEPGLLSRVGPCTTLSESQMPSPPRLLPSPDSQDDAKLDENLSPLPYPRCRDKVQYHYQTLDPHFAQTPRGPPSCLVFSRICLFVFATNFVLLTSQYPVLPLLFNI
ncbi:hypothetical protein OG21DRAFT_1283111 [Imleria badia]|nr:hypothetical protein OG21DRAFT_1283111 [Imleria badia]